MPYKSFGCSICGRQAPKKLRADGKSEERWSWLRRHRAKHHPRAHKESIRRAVETRSKR